MTYKYSRVNDKVGAVTQVDGARIYTTEGLVVMDRSSDPSDRFIYTRAEAESMARILERVSPHVSHALKYAASTLTGRQRRESPMEGL